MRPPSSRRQPTAITYEWRWPSGGCGSDQATCLRRWDSFANLTTVDRRHERQLTRGFHMNNGSTRRSCEAALLARFKELHPDIPFDASGRVPRLDDNLLPTCRNESRNAIEAAFRAGGGGELDSGKLRSVYSSAAFVVNTFCPWLKDPEALELSGIDGFSRIELERKLPTGLAGEPPNLDLVAEGEAGVVALESKLCEHFAVHPAAFAESHGPKVSELADEGWASEYEALVADPHRYRHLDAAQLVKHYLGIRNQFGEAGATLLYLYWEPANGDGLGSVERHREEVRRFSEAVAAGGAPLIARSYRDLWAEWEGRDRPDLLTEHVAALRSRYDVEISHRASS